MQFGTSGENTVTNNTENKVVSLKKGEKINLSKVTDSLEEVMIGLGWDAADIPGQVFDLDASIFLCNANDKCARASNVVFYGNLNDASGCCMHQGDNRTGAGDGDDEKILVDFKKITEDIEKLAVTVTIDNSVFKGQNFGMMNNAYVRLVDNKTNKELLRFTLTQDFSMETAIVVAELYRHNGAWKFHAIGDGFNGGLAALCENYGLEVEK